MGQKEYNIVDRADAWFLDGRVDDAIELLKKAIEENGRRLLLRVRLADYLRRVGRLEEALAVYRECALAYAEKGALPFAVAIYKLVVPLLKTMDGAEELARSLLRDLVHRYQESRARADEAGRPLEDADTLPPEIPLFGDMSREELEEVIKRLVPVQLRAGQSIFKEGDEGASMFIVTRGYVRVFSLGKDGERIRLAKLGPGDFFGEWSLITGDYRRHAWVETETNVELLELSESTLDEITKRHPRVKEVMAAYHRRRTIDTLLAKVFPSLSGIERRRLAEHLREERYPRGAVIYREGDTSCYMSIIQHGTVEVYTHNLDGVKIPLALLGPGQYFGEGGALSGKPRVASVRARTDTLLHHVSREDLVTSLIDHPEILTSLQGIRLQRIGDTLERLDGSENLSMDDTGQTANGEAGEEMV